MYAADIRHPDKNLQQKLQQLYTMRGGPAIDLTIRKPYRDLLAALGNPHLHLPPAIHVAGTNGKGSVIAMLRAVLEQAGCRVHVYTSPHLVRFNERIVLAGREIDDRHLESLLDETLAANDSAALTFFELTTALAFAAFARTPADICLIETGLGGRLDCTNVIEQPLATVITRIGYDHMEFLGETLEKIAAEKAGIMKPDTPCILAPQQDGTVQTVFEKKATVLKCPLIFAQPQKDVKMNLVGPHQNDNAAAALTCLKELKNLNVSKNDITEGLQNIRWPARLQRVMAGPHAALLPPGAELWIDGGHNESAGQALAAQAALWQAQDGKPLHIILGMMRTKDPASFMEPLMPFADSLGCVTINNEEMAFRPAELADLIKASFPFYTGIQAYPDLESALRHQTKSSVTRFLVTGSLYLAGNILGTLPQK